MHISRWISGFSLAVFAAASLHAATPVPFQYRDGMIWVKIIAAGKDEPLNFLVDSGAGVSVLDLATARKLGLKLDEPLAVQGTGGRAMAYRLRGFDARMADVPVASSLLAVDLSGPGRCCHQHIDGLLGADFFLNHIVQIDYASQTIRLLQRSEVNFHVGETLPLVRCNDTFCVRASIDGNKPELLRLDTGCSSALEWVVTDRAAKQLTATTIGLNAGSLREFTTGIQLGATRVAPVKTGLHTAQMFPGESGLIGNGLLSRFTVTIDAEKRRCILAAR